MKKIFFLLALPLVLKAQKDYPQLLDTYMQAAATINNFNGSVLVAKSGNIIYQKSFGYKDKDSKYPLNNNSMFEIGLLTNQFTDAGILLLKERGKLKLTDTLRKFFPELPYHNITIKHLLTKTSGLPDYYFVMKDIWNDKKTLTNRDVIRIFAQTKPPVYFAPGQKWDWSPTGYVLLASIIEKISGMAYNDFIEKNILKPLNLGHTKLIKGIPSLKAHDAAYAEGIYSDYIKATEMDTVKESPALVYAITYGTLGDAGINSTTGDLFLFDRALKNNTLLTATSQKEMFSPQVLVDTASQMFYSYSVNTGKNELSNYIMQSEPGASRLGYSASTIRYINEDVVIIVLCNKTKEFTSTALTGTIAYIMFDREVVPPYVHKEITIDTSLLDKYVGKYSLPNEIELIKKEGKLYRRMSGEPDVELKPESQTKFFYNSTAADIQYEFKTDNTGKVLKAFFINNGLKKEIKKY